MSARLNRPPRGAAVTAGPKLESSSDVMSAARPPRAGGRVQSLLLVLWTLVLLSHPPLLWAFGPPAVEAWASATVLTQCALLLVILAKAWGAWRALAACAAIVLLGGGVEWLGATTGFPFGAYQYTERLQPQLVGVPVAVALAWFVMLPSSWALARVITGKSRGVGFAIGSATALAAWDLFVDPQAVAWGWWRWQTPGAYFGIPATNLAGWWLTGFLLTIVIAPRPVPLGPCLYIYAAVLVTYAIGVGFLHDLPGPALVGSLAMGGALAAACARGMQQHRRGGIMRTNDDVGASGRSDAKQLRPAAAVRSCGALLSWLH
jgi:putative membrane protein